MCGSKPSNWTHISPIASNKQRTFTIPISLSQISIYDLTLSFDTNNNYFCKSWVTEHIFTTINPVNIRMTSNTQPTNIFVTAKQLWLIQQCMQLYSKICINLNGLLPHQQAGLQESQHSDSTINRTYNAQGRSWQTLLSTSEVCRQHIAHPGLLWKRVVASGHGIQFSWVASEQFWQRHNLAPRLFPQA